jgi:hypothetical protein
LSRGSICDARDAHSQLSAMGAARARERAAVGQHDFHLAQLHDTAKSGEFSPVESLARRFVGAAPAVPVKGGGGTQLMILCA